MESFRETDKLKSTKFGLSKNVISMGWVSFLNDLSSDMIFPFIPIFVTSVLGASATFVGLIEGIADATASFLKIISGKLSDKWNIRKPFMVFGYSLSAISKPLLAFATAPWHVLVVRFLDRVGKGSRDAPRDTLISLSTEKRLIGRAFGFHRGADTFGAALGPLVAFLILPLIQNDLRTLFLLSFVASFVAVIILAYFVKEIGVSKSAIDNLNIETTTPKEKIGFKTLGIPFLFFLAAATIFNLGRASEAFLLLRAQDIGITLALIPIIYFVYNTSFALLATPAGILSDRIGHRNTFMIGMLVFSVSYLFFASLASPDLIWIIFILYSLYGALTEGVGRAIVANLVEEKHRGTAFGVYNAFTGFALLPAGLIFGLLWDNFGPSFSFYYGASLGIISLLIFLFLRVVVKTTDTTGGKN